MLRVSQKGRFHGTSLAGSALYCISIIIIIVFPKKVNKKLGIFN